MVQLYISCFFSGSPLFIMLLEKNKHIYIYIPSPPRRDNAQKTASIVRAVLSTVDRLPRNKQDEHTRLLTLLTVVTFLNLGLLDVELYVHIYTT